MAHSTSSSVALLARRFSNVVSLSSSTTCRNPIIMNAIPSSSSSGTTTATKPFSTTTTAATTWNLNNSSSSSSNSHSNISSSSSNNRRFATPTTQIMMTIHRSMATSTKKKTDASTEAAAAPTTITSTNDNSVIDGGKEKSSSSPPPTSKSSSSPFLQHQEWVKFQQSITVSGFQTGQTTTATVLKKSRGGKQARRKREQELARLGAIDGVATGQQKISAVAAKFPAVRYSPDETEELLKLAYATLPPRTGKRGTRNLKRQENRWKKVRKIRSDYKDNILKAHLRRMEHRKYKRERTKEVMYDSVDQRQRDLEYQGKVLKRYMGLSHGNNSNENELEVGSGSGSILGENENKI